MSAFMDSKFGKRGGKEKIREEVVKDEGDLIFIYTITACILLSLVHCLS